MDECIENPYENCLGDLFEQFANLSDEMTATDFYDFSDLLCDALLTYDFSFSKHQRKVKGMLFKSQALTCYLEKLSDEEEKHFDEAYSNE